MPVNCPSSDACPRVFGSSRFTPRGPPVRFNAIILFLSTDHASLCAWLLCISQKSKRLRDQSTFTSDAIFAETLIFWHLVGNLVSLTSLLRQVRFQMLSNLRLHISGTFRHCQAWNFTRRVNHQILLTNFSPRWIPEPPAPPELCGVMCASHVVFMTWWTCLMMWWG